MQLPDLCGVAACSTILVCGIWQSSELYIISDQSDQLLPLHAVERHKTGTEPITLNLKYQCQYIHIYCPQVCGLGPHVHLVYLQYISQKIHVFSQTYVNFSDLKKNKILWLILCSLALHITCWKLSLLPKSDFPAWQSKSSSTKQKRSQKKSTTGFPVV